MESKSESMDSDEDLHTAACSIAGHYLCGVRISEGDGHGKDRSEGGIGDAAGEAGVAEGATQGGLGVVPFSERHGVLSGLHCQYSVADWERPDSVEDSEGGRGNGGPSEARKGLEEGLEEQLEGVPGGEPEGNPGKDLEGTLQ